MKGLFYNMLAGAAVLIGSASACLADEPQQWVEHWVDIKVDQFKDEISPKRFELYFTMNPVFLIQGVNTLPQAKSLFKPIMDEAMYDLGFVKITPNFVEKIKNDYPTANSNNGTSFWAMNIQSVNTDGVFCTRDQNALTKWNSLLTFYNSRDSDSMIEGKIRDIVVYLDSTVVYRFDPAQKGFLVTLMPAPMVFGYLANSKLFQFGQKDICFQEDPGTYGVVPFFSNAYLVKNLHQNLTKQIASKCKSSSNISPLPGAIKQ